MPQGSTSCNEQTDESPESLQRAETRVGSTQRTAKASCDAQPAPRMENSNGPLSPLSLHGRSPGSLYRGNGDKVFLLGFCSPRSVANLLAPLYLCFPSLVQDSEALMPHFSPGRHFHHAFPVDLIPLTLSCLHGTCIIYKTPPCLPGDRRYY